MLTVVTAYTIPTMLLYTGENVYSPEPEIKAKRERVVGILDQAREHLRDHPGSLAFHLVEDDPAGALVNLSQQARTVAVVGGAVSLAGSLAG